MLPYFPNIYPGELLYSVLARYVKHTALPPDTLVNNELFGKRYAIPSFDLPFGLAQLALLIPNKHYTIAKRLLEQLTLFKYLIRFALPHVAKQATRSVLKGVVTDWYLRLGMATFKVNRVTRLRFCPACNLDMLKAYGELYWKREFQLPSVVVCREHHQSLYQSTIDIRLGSRHAYYAADPEYCLVSAETRLVNDTASPSALNKLVGLANRSALIIDDKHACKSHGEWTSYYRRKLEDTGYAITDRHVKLKRLYQAVQDYYAEVFMNVPAFSEISKLKWLSPMARKHRHAFHPLHHLLLQEFLDNQPQYLPFGNGPWVCTNPLAEHVGKPSIQKYSVHANFDHHVAVFECSCGYVFTRWFNHDSGEVGPNRFQHYGPLLKPKLIQYILEGLSLRNISQLLKLDPKTVVKLANDLDIRHPWQMKLQIGRYCHQAKRTNIEVTDEENLKNTISAKLDWDKIDKDLKQAVVNEVRRIRKIAPPIKVTLAVIERGLQRPHWIGRRKHKLPLTTKYLSAAIESHAEFRFRRMVWAIKQLQQNRQALFPSHVTRLAGIRHDAFKYAQPKLSAYLH
jgi:hypothetical protein